MAECHRNVGNGQAGARQQLPRHRPAHLVLDLLEGGVSS
jgi:hypothetical protein